MEESEEEVTVLVGVGSPEEARTQLVGAAPEARAVRSSESKKGEQ